MSGSTDTMDRGEPVDPQAPPPNVDQLLVISIKRWALIVAALVILFDMLLLAGYPFPGVIEALRGPLYTLFGVAIIVGVLTVSFLGYRLVTMRVVRSRRTIWVLFLPAVVLLASIGSFMLLTAPK